MRIFLIGYMGSGKSTLGKKLAQQLHLPFFDTDKEIERKQGLSISEIFSLYGESHFRQLESNYLTEISKSLPRGVFATGGGMPCYTDAIERINSMGTSIYLERSPAELAYRLINSKQKRPLIEGKNEAELLKFVQNQLKIRSKFYRQATILAERNEQTVTILSQKLANLDLLHRND